MASILKVESIQNPSAVSPSIDIDSSGNMTFTGTVTKSGGTANGVLYLNGSGVETSGSALQFDGTNLGVGVTPTTSDTYKTIELAASGSGLYSFASSPDVSVVCGLYYNSGWKYAVTGSAVSQYQQEAGAHRWFTAASGTAGNACSKTQAMTLDASGNLGVRVTPSAWAASKALQIGNRASVFSYSDTTTDVGNNTYFNGSDYKYLETATASFYRQSSGNHSWLIAPAGTAGNTISFTQAMTLDASGNLLVGTTTFQGRFTVTATGSTTIDCARTETSLANQIILRNGNGAVGSITTSGTTTAYNTSSDYRLKENVQPMTGALAKIAALKPVTYKWKVDGSDGEGFIAHELQAVIPNAVVGEKDAVDADGKPVYQGIDTSFLVATLTAAIKELKAENDSLKARLDASGL